MPGFDESSSNGRYYGKQQIPTAQTQADKEAMLAQHLRTGTIIEVLIPGDLPLPEDTTVICYAEPDAELAQKILMKIDSPWQVVTETVRRPTRIVNEDGCKTRLWQAEPSGRIAKRPPDTQQGPVRRNHDGKYRIAERGGIGIHAERMQRGKNRDGSKARPAA